MAEILKPEQIADQLGFNDLQKFRRDFSDLITVISGQELMDKELVDERLNHLVNPNSDKSIDKRKKRIRKSSGENLGQVKSLIKRLQKSIRRQEPEVDKAREKHERSKNSEDRLQYLLMNKNLMDKQNSLIIAQKEYDRIIEARIEDIEGPEQKDQN